MTTIGSLCSGYGGLELAALDLWPDATVAFHAETDPHAATVLAAHWPDVPNVGDINRVDWAEAEPVDVLTAGYPCQPFSTAGRRGGADDPRNAWPGVLRAVRDLRPRLVLLENVGGHLSMGFGRVLGDLAKAGFDARWTCLRASDVGACHRRERLFVVAADTSSERRHPWAGLRSRRPTADGRTEPGDGVAADTDEPRSQGPQSAERRLVPDRCPPADADGSAGLQRHFGQVEPGQRAPRRVDVERRGVCVGGPFGAYQPAIDRWASVIGRPAPPPLVGLERTAEPVNRPQDRQGGRLNARFVEWLMGVPEGWVTDLVPRRHALRILGNGCVPLQAATAYRMLMEAE